MIVIVMGVAGSGKTTVGQALAEALGATFLDADDFHPPANIEKMAQGIPLTDADRQPWLDAIHAALFACDRRGQPTVLACSALKADYRSRLSAGRTDAIRWVYLNVDRETLLARMTGRTTHFMPPALLDSQLQTLEEPADAITVDAKQPVADIVASVVHCLTAE